MKLLLFVAFVFIFNNFIFSQEQNSDSIYCYVDKMPEYPNGDIALYSFIANNLKIPDNNSFVTKIIYKFIIE
jgi:hypothetical protein